MKCFVISILSEGITSVMLVKLFLAVCLLSLNQDQKSCSLGHGKSVKKYVKFLHTILVVWQLFVNVLMC